MVAIVCNMLFGVVFGFRSTEDFILHACQIARILNNVDKTGKKKKKKVCLKSIIICMNNAEKNPSHLILYTICFQLS